MEKRQAIVPVALLCAYAWMSQQSFEVLTRAGKALGPYGFSLIVNTAAIVLIILVLQAQGQPALRALGIARSPLRPLLFGLLATTPAWLGFLLTAQPHAFTARQMILLCWYFPFAEELIFRGYVFGQLYFRARLGFWPSALIPALIFAACHLYQSNEPLELLGIFAITALGSLVFSYFLIRFDGNLWAPVALHALLNTWWMVFTSNNSALGGYADNLFRFASIGLAFGIVRWFATKRRPGNVPRPPSQT
ncbi:MAG TPA: CPBP family intramembrane glutamic endopeptidase [Myxococcales bacterium]|jgi:hypothetical protein|nr:CPBP family intramembrane glutamic endopeptidase [Myxococcales bacterium]